jgi:hypothetical protein
MLITVFTRADCPSDSLLKCPLSVVVSVNVPVQLSVAPFLGHTNGLSDGQIDGKTDGQGLGNCWRVHVIMCPICNAVVAAIQCFHFQCEDKRQDRHAGWH